jgi:O-acetyl-ADP-ribose deacetylase (regulator of RNase III)
VVPILFMVHRFQTFWMPRQKRRDGKAAKRFFKQLLRKHKGERELLAGAYRSALSFYDELPNVRSISFVSMGTGVYRWPLELAAEISIKELALSKFEVTTMCVIDEATRTAYQRACGKLDI